MTRRSRAAGLWRTLGAWVVLLLVIAGVAQLRRWWGQRAAKITYTQFSAQLKTDNVPRVTIIPDGREIKGELRRPTVIGQREVSRFQAYLPFADPAPLVQRIEAKDVPIVAASGVGSWATTLLWLLPWLLIIGVGVFLFRLMRAGAHRAFSFGRIGAKTVRADQPQVTFDDVAGADEAKEELRDVIEFLKDPERFRPLGGRMPKGVLLVGPPGTGKTLLARVVAGEAGVSFFSISGPDFVEMFVGVGAARVRNLFQVGKANAPCIIFIDELDAVGRLRGSGLGGGHDEREQTLNQLLVELDGFEPTEGVVLLAATNRPDVLDPALLRRGRFDRQIVVDLPDIRGREMILKVHARKVPLAEDVDFTRIARGTPGLSGADLANMLNEATLLAAHRNRGRVEQQDLEDAKDKVMVGVERKRLVLTEGERRVSAYHEAGHALLNVLIPGLDPLDKVTIVPRGGALGMTFSLPDVDRHSYTKAFILRRLVVAYGGRVAEELVFGPDQVTTCAAEDFEQATQLARRMVTEFGMSDVVGPMTVSEREPLVFLGRELGPRREISERTAELVDTEVRHLVTDAHDQARQLLSDNPDKLHTLAQALLERETLTREDVEALVRPGWPSVRPRASGRTRVPADSVSRSALFSRHVALPPEGGVDEYDDTRIDDRAHERRGQAGRTDV